MSFVNFQLAFKEFSSVYVLYFLPFVIMTVLSSWNVLLSTWINLHRLWYFRIWDLIFIFHNLIFNNIFNYIKFIDAKDTHILNLMNFICLIVDIVLIKVNSQKVIEWITSFDFNNDYDSYAYTLNYDPYLYLSMSGGMFQI